MQETDASTKPGVEMTWTTSDVPPGWKILDRETISATFSDRDRGHGFTHEVRVTREQFLRSGNGKSQRYLWLKGQLDAARDHLDRTMTRIRDQRPHTFDYAIADRVMHMVKDFWPAGQEAPWDLMLHRSALAISQVRGELNLDIFKAPPIEDLNPYEELAPALNGEAS